MQSSIGFMSGPPLSLHVQAPWQPDCNLIVPCAVFETHMASRAGLDLSSLLPAVPALGKQCLADVADMCAVQDSIGFMSGLLRSLHVHAPWHLRLQSKISLCCAKNPTGRLVALGTGPAKLCWITSAALPGCVCAAQSSIVLRSGLSGAM